MGAIIYEWILDNDINGKEFKMKQETMASQLFVRRQYINQILEKMVDYGYLIKIPTGHRKPNIYKASNLEAESAGVVKLNATLKQA